MAYDCAVDKNCARTEKIRKYYQFLARNMTSAIGAHLDREYVKKQNWTTASDWREKSIGLEVHYYNYMKKGKGVQVATKIASVTLQNKNVGWELQRELRLNFSVEFPTYLQWKVEKSCICNSIYNTLISTLNLNYFP